MSEDLTTTKDRLLDAAEDLFASRCFDEVSIRELAAAAGVNVAAVNYHFQGKDNLYQEVILRRFISQRDLTLAALELTLAEAGGLPSLDSVIRTMVREYLRGTLGPASGGSFLSLMAREMQGAQSHASDTLFPEVIAPVFQAFSRALMAACPRLQQEDLNWLIASIVGQIHHFVFRWKKKQTLPPDSLARLTMLRLFPALGLPVEAYIETVTDHITNFSSAAVLALHPEVE